MFFEIPVTAGKAGTFPTSEEVQKQILASLPSPPPRPNCPGNWALLRGEHWLLYNPERGFNMYWASMSDNAISAATSNEHRYQVGLINDQQRGLLEGIIPVLIENHSRLQRRVYQFVSGSLETTNHPLAPWNIITYGIHRDGNGVWSPFDLAGHRFLHHLKVLHNSIPRNYGCEYMLRVLHLILCDPGRYALLVAEFYPTVSILPADDPLGITFLDSSRRFDPDRYAKLDAKAVVQYLWETLKIPRLAAQFNLEPFVQLSSSVESAITVWQELTDPMANDAPQLSYRSSMTKAQSEAGTLFHEAEQLTFECGPFPLEDDVTGAVRWAIPPLDAQAAVARVKLCTTWIPGFNRKEFKARHSARQRALGIFEYL